MTGGILIGIGLIIIAAFVIRILYRRHSGDYDERQKSMRGVGYRTGMITIVVLQITCMFIKDATSILDRFDWDFILFSTLMVGILVFVIYSILHDSFFGIIKHERSYILLCILIIFSNLIFVNKNMEAWQAENMLTFVNSANLICALMFIVVLGALIVRRFQVKSGEE